MSFLEPIGLVYGHGCNLTHHTAHSPHSRRTVTASVSGKLFGPSKTPTPAAQAALRNVIHCSVCACLFFVFVDACGGGDVGGECVNMGVGGSRWVCAHKEL